eukprot:TRINITY_DN17693_c0_g1_i1.p1 TRINITY_DN17693_c0_g1~~TRINITY_DN17693_c0_g1_i1.p1  ORF type:complete len:664 (+),score=168.45 TRINITY_DN17693_c0_g1_i1:50-2041(+)
MADLHLHENLAGTQHQQKKQEVQTSNLIEKPTSMTLSRIGNKSSARELNVPNPNNTRATSPQPQSAPYPARHVLEPVRANLVPPSEMVDNAKFKKRSRIYDLSQLQEAIQRERDRGLPRRPLPPRPHRDISLRNLKNPSSPSPKSTHSSSPSSPLTSISSTPVSSPTILVSPNSCNMTANTPNKPCPAVSNEKVYSFEQLDEFIQSLQSFEKQNATVTLNTMSPTTSPSSVKSDNEESESESFDLLSCSDEEEEEAQSPHQSKAKEEAPSTEIKKVLDNNNNNNDNNNVLNQPSEHEQMRRRVFEEILHTERDYITDLVMLTKLYYMPIKEKELLTERNCAKVFSNVVMLLNVNKELLGEIEKPQAIDRVGATFHWMSNFLKMYTQYSNNHPTALEAVRNCKKENPLFSNYLDTIPREHPETKGQTLQSYLIKPIQRVTKYPLLLREMLKYTTDDHPDAKKLKESLKRLEQILCTINDSKIILESNQKMAELRKKLKGSEKLVAPSRRFVREDEIKEFVKTEDGKFSHVGVAHYYLFNNLLLRAIDQKTITDFLKNKITQKVSEMVSLTAMNISFEVTPIDFNTISSIDATYQPLRVIMTLRKPQRLVEHVLLFQSVEDRKDWSDEVLSWRNQMRNAYTSAVPAKVHEKYFVDESGKKKERAK